MMAAVMAADNGHHVVLCEQNEKLGKKLYITGKGRCNVTNRCDVEELVANVISNPKFLYSAFYSFDSRALMQMIERAGCPLKTERGGRVFPVSDHASDILKAFQKMLEKRNVQLRLHTKVEDIVIENGRITGVIIQNKKEKADAVILATGGLAYPATGSTGDGYAMAERTGHTITLRKPALVPFVIKEPWYERLQGLSLRNVRAALYDSGKELYSGFGEMLFTHFGVSGPLILSASSYYAKKAKSAECRLLLDLKPALSEEQLDKRIRRDFEANRNKQFKNAVSGLFPARITPVMIELSGIDPEKKACEVTKEERQTLVHLIKNWSMTVTGVRGFEEAIITQGGVSVKHVNPSTMESKLIKGLYFAGELLDVDALTGGFNLQIAWATGHLAGSSIPLETDGRTES